MVTSCVVGSGCEESASEGGRLGRLGAGSPPGRVELPSVKDLLLWLGEWVALVLGFALYALTVAALAKYLA